MKHLLKILPLIVIAAILSACNSDGCTDGSRALPHAVMYKVGTNEKTSVSNLPVYGIGAPGDSMIVDTSTVSEFYLPLRPSADETRFVIDYTDLDHVSDTLTMHYEAVPYFVSEDCGVTFFYNITSYEHTQHVINQVEIADPLITNVDRVSVRIYYDPDALKASETTSDSE